MKREKTVQITEQLFLEIAQYFLLDKRDANQESAIIQGISDKVEAIIRHDLYTKYKTAPTAELQEQARMEYLEKAGIPQAFRW